MLSHILPFLLFIGVVSSANPICTNGFTLVSNKCLKLFPSTVTHKVAERSCMDLGATLVTVKNSNDNHAITAIAGTSTSVVWMGLFCLDNDPSKCLWDDATGSAEMYSTFASGFPHIDVGKCVYYSVKGALAGQWLSGDCEKDTKSYICELPVTYQDSCPFNYNGHCYTFHPPSTFTQAQTTCEKECGNLASINSANENRYLNTLSNKQAPGNLYIGATWPTQDVFNWIDGSLWTYNNIDLSYSHGATCVAMANGAAMSVSSGLWFSIDCHMSLNFVCKRPAGMKCNPGPVVAVTEVPKNPSYCNSSVQLAPGVITSPDYPFQYDNNQNCVYQLATLGSYNILLRFSDFGTEAKKDYVTVYDGDSVNSPVIGTYSGDLSSFSLVSTGNVMTVAFKSDGAKGARGFSARFTSYSYGR
uniref:C-type LECtin n=1 Tax=Caenorhabditis tropicalis TaxID=1561998 RepID=A0A1I7U561_9PELO